MRRSTFLFTLILLSVQTIFAQKNVIVTIDGQPVTKDEFEVIYQKNNTNLNDDSEIKTPMEYMDMFVDFKLKVHEAEKQGLDTTRSFKDELKGYRDELAKTYLTDVAVTDSMVKEAYYRSTHFLKVSHILIELPEDASPEDTLKACNKLVELRNMYLSKEKTFEELAREYSNDPSAADNGGELPYFGAFRMITPFENAAFKTPVGEVSMPIRSQVGMHIILVKEKILSAGEIKVGNIMKKFSTNDGNISAEEDNALHASIDSLYNLLVNGADWAEVADKFSDDRLSVKNGGVMKFISQEFSVPEFVDAAFSLKNDGDYSKPFRTQYGWHIIKRFEAKPVSTFDEMKSELTKKVKADPLRAKYSKDKFINDRKAEYGYELFQNNYAQFTNIIKGLSSDTIYQLPADCQEIKLFKFAGRDYTAQDYFDTIMTQFSLKYILRFKFIAGFDEYVEKLITDYEDTQLEAKYPEFNYIIKEYHDGILLFSIMEKEVWNKAIADTVGLANYYDQHKGQYKLDEHFDGMLIKCNNEETRKIVEKAIADGIDNSDSLQAIAVQAGGNRNSVTKGRWEKGSNRYIDYFVWKGEKTKEIKENCQFVVGSIKNGGTKTFEEARGLYIADYQAVIEKEWIKQLHDKYKIEVNEKLLRKVKSLKKS